MKDKSLNSPNTGVFVWCGLPVHDSGYLCEAAQTLFTDHLKGIFALPPPAADSAEGKVATRSAVIYH